MELLERSLFEVSKATVVLCGPGVDLRVPARPQGFRLRFRFRFSCNLHLRRTDRMI
jgi:hypothetical protein